MAVDKYSKKHQSTLRAGETQKKKLAALNSGSESAREKKRKEQVRNLGFVEKGAVTTLSKGIGKSFKNQLRGLADNIKSEAEKNKKVGSQWKKAFTFGEPTDNARGKDIDDPIAHINKKSRALHSKMKKSYGGKGSGDYSGAIGGLTTEGMGAGYNANGEYKEATDRDQERAAATNDTFEQVFDQIFISDTNNGQVLNKTMRLFGMPFQFNKAIDARVKEVSEVVGRKFINNIITEAPVVTIVPGKPDYLPMSKNKVGYTHAFMQAATGNLGELQQLISEEDKPLRYYDFKQCYTEYMTYVNIMCRTAATFLELTEDIDGTPLQSYDWRNYRWNGRNYETVAGKMLKNAGKKSLDIANGIVQKVTEYGAAAVDAIRGNKSEKGDGHKLKYDTTSNKEAEADEFADSIFQTANFVQFYCDPDFSPSESASNSTTTSKIEGVFSTASDAFKEIAFVMNSGGLQDSALVKGADEFINGALAGFLDKITGPDNLTVGSLSKRVLDLSGHVTKGEGIIMPEIYSGSDYKRQYSITINLRTPYGNRYSYFKEVLVPLFHLLALALPKQTSANTFGAPFLIKAYCEGIFTCNLGMVTSLTINKNVSPDSWTIDASPGEMQVTLDIVDLYSDLTMSPQTSPLLFLSNSSMIDYLATTCGLNLIQPQLHNKLNYSVNVLKNAFGDIKENIAAQVGDAVENALAPWWSLH